MGTQTKIEWADSTWSPWRGCTKVSPGCANCYAEALAARNPGVLGGWGKGAPRVLAKNWDEPVGWNRKATQRFTEWRNRWDGTMQSMFNPRSVPPAPPKPRVFPSLCDWLDDEVPVEWLGRFLRLIEETPHLDWLLLTKRPENWGKRLRAAHCATTGPVRIAIAEWLDCNPPVNVWLGVSVEDQKRAEERIPLLLETPARLRWLSVEPLLGPVDLTRIDAEQSRGSDLCMVNALTGRQSDMGRPCPDLRPIDWVVVGGESGPKARVCHADWIRSLVRQCEGVRVPVFVKQVGTRPVDRVLRGAEWGTLRDRKGGDPDEWPMELNVRQFPDALTKMKRDLSAKLATLAKHPAAVVIRLNKEPEQWRVWAHYRSGAQFLGQGATEEEAWKNASRKTGAKTRTVRCRNCFDVLEIPEAATHPGFCQPCRMAELKR